MGEKFIFFDVDGTLISHVGKSHVPEPTIQAVKALARNGHVPAIATGRNLAMTRKIAAFFSIDLVVSCNGANVTRLAAGLDIHSAWLSDGFVRDFRASPPSVSEQAYALDAEHVYTDWADVFLDAFITEEGGEGCKRNLAAMKRAQLAYVFSKPLRSWMERDDVDVIETSGYTEFRPREVSKWNGIIRAAEVCGFDPADVVTVGDGLNDVEMLENAPIGIAVGGADNRLKALADLVTDDIDRGGILSAFRSLGMI